MNEEDIKKIKKIATEFLQKMTITDFNIELNITSADEKNEKSEENFFSKDKELGDLEVKSIVDLDIELKDPQILIGSNGQTLFELQRILRIILNKKLGIHFYLKLDINNYKKKKIEHLKSLAQNIANEVSLAKEKKILFPMPAYQRRIIHMELAKRKDVVTESEGDGDNRCIVIKSVIREQPF